MSRWEKLRQWLWENRRRWLFIVFGGAVGFLALVSGVFDTLMARPLEARLFGLALAIVGAGLLVGAACELYRPWQRTLAVDVAFWSGIASLAITVYLLSLGLPPATAFLWVWIAIICAFTVAGILALLTFRAWWPAEQNMPNPTSRTPWWILSAVGVTASLLFSIFQFWYAGALTSSKAQGWGVNLVVQLKDDGPQRRDPHTHNFTLHFFLKNSSGEQLRLVNSLYVLSGLTWPPDLATRQTKMLQYGTVLTPNLFVQTTEELSDDVHVEIPSTILDSYSALGLWVQVELIRSDDVILAPNTLSQTLKSDQNCRLYNRGTIDSCQATTWALERPSLLWRLTRGDQVLVSTLLVNPESAWLDFCVDAWPGPTSSKMACVPNFATSYFERLYKLSWVTARFDLPLKPESMTSTRPVDIYRMRTGTSWTALLP